MSLSAVRAHAGSLVITAHTERANFAHLDEGAVAYMEKSPHQSLFLSRNIPSRIHITERERSEPDKTLKAAARQDNPVYISLQFKRTKYIHAHRATLYIG